jgi:hypothetical protein
MDELPLATAVTSPLTTVAALEFDVAQVAVDVRF